jgi:hypothetical protein
MEIVRRTLKEGKIPIPMMKLLPMSLLTSDPPVRFISLTASNAGGVKTSR